MKVIYHVDEMAKWPLTLTNDIKYACGNISSRVKRIKLRCLLIALLLNSMRRLMN